MDPSVLQHSIQAASAQNMADRITVSLKNHKHFNYEVAPVIINIVCNSCF